jgi:hypothetical protein
MTRETKTAASFVDLINAAYREVVKAESSALPHAIKCGEFLNLAKENVKAEKKKWGDWLSANCPEIAQETASLYMRLAEHKVKVSKAKSVREARELLPKATPLEMPSHLQGRQSTIEHNDGLRDSDRCHVGFECHEKSATRA